MHAPSLDPTPAPCPRGCVVVGGGAAGVITAAHLLRAADAEHRSRCSVVEKAARPRARAGLPDHGTRGTP